MSQVKIKILDGLEAVLPTFARQGDAGADLRSNEALTIAPGETIAVGTGLAFELPDDMVALVCSRSGLALKQSVFVLNAPGVVDSGYRGEVKVILHNAGQQPFTVQPGDRIAQAMFQKFESPTFVEANELSDSARGNRGFGSSGTQQVIA